MAAVQPIFQNPFEAFNPLKRVDRYLLATARQLRRRARTTREAQAAADAALRKVGLSFAEVTRRFPHELSGGQLQRVAIARALIPKPALIVADEPVSMVDASLRMSIVNLFKTLRDDLGVSIIYITHDLATAYYISDRIIIMQKGKVVEGGDARDGARRPAASLHPAPQGFGALGQSAGASAPARPRPRRPDARTRPIEPPDERDRMHEAKLTFDRSDAIGDDRPRACSAPSSSISAAASMAASTSPAIRPRPSRAFAATCSSWCASSGRRSSAIPAATSSPATTGRTASARSRSGPSSWTSPG